MRSRRRVFKIIVTEDWNPQDAPYDLGPCSTVSYKFNYKGEQYGSYLTYCKPFLSDDEVAEAAAALIPTALEAMRILEADDAKE